MGWIDPCIFIYFVLTEFSILTFWILAKQMNKCMVYGVWCIKGCILVKKLRISFKYKYLKKNIIHECNIAIGNLPHIDTISRRLKLQSESVRANTIEWPKLPKFIDNSLFEFYYTNSNVELNLSFLVSSVHLDHVYDIVSRTLIWLLSYFETWKSNWIFHLVNANCTQKHYSPMLFALYSLSS